MGSVILLVVLLVLNFGISALNAWSVGRSWHDSKAVGGWIRFVVLCAAIMSACGFTWVYLFLEAFGLHYFGQLSLEDMEALLALGYLVLIFPILGSGIGITAHSWLAFARQRSLTNAGVAGWNTFAQVHNMYEASKGVPKALEIVSKFFKSKEGPKAFVIVVLFLGALVLGIGSTWLIVHLVAKNHKVAIDQQFANARAKIAS